MERFLSKIRRHETPFYEFLFNAAFRFKRLNMPNFFLPVYRVIGALREGLINFLRRSITFFYYEPMFRSRCRRVGKNLHYVKLRQGFPYFHGDINIVLGENVTVHSRSSFSAASLFEKPTLNVGDNTYLGPGLSIGVAERISIGSSCLIGSNVSISDNDGHPLDACKRAKGDSVNKFDIFPVQIGDKVWLGDGSIVLKGVSVGEGAVIGARSVLTTDVAPYTVAAGNPARAIGKIPKSDES